MPDDAIFAEHPYDFCFGNQGNVKLTGQP